MDTSEGREPWLRQGGEPSMWYGRFIDYYLGQGSERTLSQAVDLWRRATGRSGRQTRNVPSSWYKNWQKWRWKDRAQAWDDAQRRVALTEAERKTQAMLQRHAELGRGLSTLASIKLGWLLKVLREHPDSEILTVQDVRHLARAGVEMERLSVGLPKELVALMAMDDRELMERYADLIREIAGIGSAGADAEGEGS